jgi:hypothetical protein
MTLLVTAVKRGNQFTRRLMCLVGWIRNRAMAGAPTVMYAMSVLLRRTHARLCGVQARGERREIASGATPAAAEAPSAGEQ